MNDKQIELCFVTSLYSNNAEESLEITFQVPETWLRSFYAGHREVGQYKEFSSFDDFVERFSDVNDELCIGCFEAAVYDDVCRTEVELNSLGLFGTR